MLEITDLEEMINYNTIKNMGMSKHIKTKKHLEYTKITNKH